jgi:hypothetical protein
MGVNMSRNAIADWERPGLRGSRINVNQINHFNARGMRMVYGRGDHFGGGRAFHMDVWVTKEGRILARFWSYRSEVDSASFEVEGLSLTRSPRVVKGEMDERWVPQRLRVEYDEWILSEL